MAGIFAPIDTDGSPVASRTRGSFDPGAVNNAAVANLPIKADVVIGPYLDVTPGDSFVVARPFAYTGLSNGSVNAKVGDRLVYIGGTITDPLSWMYVDESAKYGGIRVAVVSQLDPAFLM